MGKKYRVGIDVGGTFTDAVVLDNDTYEVVAKKKIRTTHKQGVASGIVSIISDILKENNISSDQIVFIAHGTTQATNALLEADVAKVGIIGMGQSRQAKSETSVNSIVLSQGKKMRIVNDFVDSRDSSKEKINSIVDRFKKDNVEVVVVSEAYSVDNPENEERVAAIVKDNDMYVTTAHEISELYGLKMRTRTAAINGSLVPKMIETADMTEQAVEKSGIKTGLMIMRCDGGVMSIDEVRKRPILTMLSGLAAGVAGALMYEKISDGIFLEIGGTSIDVTVIKNGKVMIKNAQVGGHKTYVQSLDVRTMALAGGTMVRIVEKKIKDVGPRSSHIAGADYDCFISDLENIEDYHLELISPKDGDPKEYAVLKNKEGKTIAFTLCGAANLLKIVPENDYAYSNSLFNEKAWEILGDYLGLSKEEAASMAMNQALLKLNELIESLIEEYELEKELVTLVGGGGSAGVLVPAFAERHGFQWKIADNAPYISTIGVALAMVREQIERTIINPTNEDIKKIRKDVKEKIVKSGAVEDTIEIAIEIESQRNLVRAVATGSTELRVKSLGDKLPTDEELIKIAEKNLNIEKVEKEVQTGRWKLFKGKYIEKKLFGLVKSTKQRICVIDREGVVRFKNINAQYTTFTKESMDNFKKFVEENTFYSDANEIIPKVFVFFKEKMLDFTGLRTYAQIQELLEVEIEDIKKTEKILAVAYH